MKAGMPGLLKCAQWTRFVKRLGLICILISPYALQTASAQTELLRFQEITPEARKGFTTDRIRSITQDEQGFLWFGSWTGGFARYDGYEFKSYTANPDDPAGLASNAVHTLYADPEGGLWIGTDKGLHWLDPETDQLTLMQHDPDDPDSLSSNLILSILRDGQGRLWVGTVAGLNRLDVGETRFRRYPLTADANQMRGPIRPTWVWCLYEDSNGTLWVGMLGSGLLRYDSANDHFDRWVNDPDNPGSLPGNNVRGIVEEKDGFLWVSTDSGLVLTRENKLLANAGEDFVRIAYPEIFANVHSHNVGAMLIDGRGDFWASLYEHGVMRSPAAKGDFLRYFNDPTDPNSPGPGDIHTIFEDRSGILWFGGTGISRLVPEARAFSLIATEPGANRRHLLRTEDGRMLAGGEDGVHVYDPNQDSWTRFQPFPGEENNDLNHVQGGGIYQDRSGQIWVITAFNLSRFDLESGHFETRELAPSANCIHKDRAGQLWICVPFKGLGQFDFKAGELQLFAHDANDPASISHDFGYFIHEDRQGQLWYGSESGLNRYDRATGKATRYYRIADDPESLSNDKMLSVIEDEAGNLWFGTAFGLNRYLPKTGTFKRYFNGTDPSANRVSSIAAGANGLLWLAIPQGVARFDPANGEFRNYTTRDGLPVGFSDEILAGEDDMLYLPSDIGIVGIHTPSLEPPAEPPASLLPTFACFNKPVGQH